MARPPFLFLQVRLTRAMALGWLMIRSRVQVSPQHIGAESADLGLVGLVDEDEDAALQNREGDGTR